MCRTVTFANLFHRLELAILSREMREVGFEPTDPLGMRFPRRMDLSVVPTVSRLWPCLATPAFGSQLN